ncbi:MAG: hypothetical protein ACTHMO_03765 [Rhodanobacteraceae bacterium]
MHSTITVSVGIRLSWWYRPYMALLTCAHRRFGFTPSEAHLTFIARHAVHPVIKH